MSRRNKLARRIRALEHNVDALMLMLYHRDEWQGDMLRDLDALFDQTITPEERAMIAEARLRRRVTD